MSEKTINFDTHRFVKRLVESGLAGKTAEVLADEQSRLLIAQGGVIVTLIGLLG